MAGIDASDLDLRGVRRKAGNTPIQMNNFFTFRHFLKASLVLKKASI